MLRPFALSSYRKLKYESIDDIHQSLRSNQYFGYPIVFLDYPGTSCELRSKDIEYLAKLIIGLKSGAKLKPNKLEEIANSDLSIMDNHLVFLTEGAATIFQCGEISDDDDTEKIQTAEELHDLFENTVPITVLVLQKAILGIYQAQLDNITLNSAGLDQLYILKRDLLSGIDEYQVLGLSHYGSIHELIENGQTSLRIDSTYALLEQRLNAIDNLVNSAESKRRGSYENFTKVATTIISALLSLPVAHSIVDIISQWANSPSRHYPAILQIPFSWIVDQFKTRPTFYTILIYTGIMVVSLIAIWGGRITSRKKQQTAIPKPIPTKSKHRILTPMKIVIQRKDLDSEIDDNPDGEF